MKYEITDIKCRIRVTNEQFDALDELDYLSEVLPVLEKVGASDVEYDGHFGLNVYFTCSDEKEARAITDKLRKLTADQLWK